ncbi:MAG: amino acid permease [Prolixibacteraceae bacterium]|nr:amino acid permease [Prolixibacteraceae bacterium]MBT6764210.1 amino acid permease [Prolixibacteraceae bacterium]MBT6997276.1 amino acid permease [Prolixibacteraceae bacterium]MBT7396859.1 amino acid permease [Prolixibacteraceae bacterium]
MNQKKFGAFAGVFTPSILTILGVIMYLRLGWVVGQAGLIAAIAIIIVAHVISITTGLSITAISTDKKIKAGGLYYMLSRSLGLPMGGAIGITLFVGTALSISLYLVGFTESVFAIEGIRNFLGLEGSIDDIRIVGSIILIFLVILAFISTSLAIKTQFIILGAIALSLFSIFFGIFSNVEFQPADVSRIAIDGHVPFETIFAIFFPAVTGFTAGVAMSGDLRNPKKSIPVGTLGAIFIGLVVYLSLAFVFAYFVDRDLLLNDTNFLTKIAWFSPLVIAGIWGATLSSALGGILGGPRILQAVAADKILPRIFARRQGVNNEPRNALILTFLIAEGGILIGELNAIAEVVSMFYISAYGFINLSFALEKWASSDFRPSFKAPGWIGIIGFAASFIVMFKMNTMAMFASMVIIGFIYIVLKRKQFQLDFGDVWQSVYTTLIRTSLHKIDQRELEQRNWMPNIILFSSGTKNRQHLLEFGKNLVGKHGFLSNFDLIETKDEEIQFSKHQQSVKDELSKEFQGIFSRKQTVSDIYGGIETIAQTYGFSGVEPNTVMLNWAKKGHDSKRFVHMLNTISNLDLNIIMMDYDRSVGFGKYETIDIWWRGGGHNGNFALSLTKFLWASDQWRNAKLRLLIVNPNNDAREKIERDTNKILENIRINAEVKVINNQIERRTFYKIIRDESINTDLIIMGIPMLKQGAEEDFVNDTTELCKDIGTVLFLKASTQFKELSVGSSLFKKGAQKQTIEISNIQKAEIEIPKIEHTKHKKLNVELATLETNIKSLFNQLIDNHQKIDFQANSLLLSELNKRVKNSLNTWKTELDEKTTTKFATNQTSTIVTRLRKLINDEYKDQLEIIKDQNNNFINSYKEETDWIIEKLPQTVVIVLSDEDIKKGEKENAGVRFFKFKQRIIRKINKKEIEYSVQLNRFVRSNFLLHRYSILLNYYSGSGLLIYQSHILFKKLSENILKSIELLDKHAYYNKISSDVIEQTQKEINAYFELYNNQINELQHSLKQKTLVEISTHLQQLTELLKTTNPNCFIKSNSAVRSIEKRGFKLLQAIPEHNLKNWLLLSNSQRLSTLLQYYTAQLTAIFSNNRKNFAEKVNDLHRQLSEKIAQSIDTEENGNLQTNIELTVMEISSSIREIKENTIKRINQISGRLPNHLVIINKDSANRFETLQFKQIQSIDISFSHLVDYITQNEIIEPFGNYISQHIETLELDFKRANDAHRLLKLSLKSDVSKELTKTEQKKQFEVQKEKTNKALETLLTNFDINDRHFTEIINTVFEKLQYQNFIDLASNQKRYTNAIESRKRSNYFFNKIKSTKTAVKEKLTSLVYLTSSSTLAAQDYIQGDAQSLFQSVKKEIEKISPKEPVLNQLPFYYKQLFLNKQHFLNEFWVSRETIMKSFLNILEENQSISKSVILLLGDRNSGKSFWLNQASSIAQQQTNIIVVQPTYNQTTDVKSFNNAIRKATRGMGTIESVFENLKPGTCLAFDDLELWWNQKESGNKVVSHLLKLIQAYSAKVRFVLSANTISYEIMKRSTDLKNLQPYIFICKPMNAKEIGKAVLKRHYSGGIPLGNMNRKNGRMSTIDEAKFFSKLFLLSFGNIGYAMQLWLSSIEKVEKDTIFIKKQELPDLRFLESLPSEWIIILNQLIIHKRLKFRYFESADNNFIKTINEMLRSTILVESAKGYVSINSFIYPYILNYFQHNKLI